MQTLIHIERQLLELRNKLNRNVSKKKSREKLESVKQLRKDIDGAINSILEKLEPILSIEVDRALRELSDIELQMQNWDKITFRANYQNNAARYDQDLIPLIGYFDGFLPYISNPRLVGNIEVFKERAQLIRGKITAKVQFDQVLQSLGTNDT